MSIIAGVAAFALGAFFLLMWVRFILELASNFSRNWRPRGLGLVVAEVAFTVTDPPIKGVRRVIPPLRLGGVSLDFGWSIVMIVVFVLLQIAVNLSQR